MSATAKKKAPKSKRPSKNGKPKKRAPKMRQQFLPGCEPPRIPALDNAAEAYYDSIRERLPYTQKEKEAKEELLKQMHLNRDKLDGATRYETPEGLIVTITEAEKVKVEKKTPAEYVHEAAAKREQNGEE